MTERDWQDELRTHREREKKARDILGVSNNAAMPEIRRAFRLACRRTHPDAAGNDPKAVRRFRLICSARRFLENNETSDELDSYELADQASGDQPDKQDNPWSYWCWWRETYLGDNQE